MDATPRLPAYLKPAADKIAERAEPIAAGVSSFLRRPVRLGNVEVSRTVRRDGDDTDRTGEVFDVIGRNGQVDLRITVSAATAATVTRALFGGDVMERPVLAGISQAFCRQIAIAALELTASEDGTPPDVTLRKAEPGPLGKQPTLTLDLRYALMTPPDVEIKLEYPRRYTDRLSAPAGKLGDTALKSLPFPITAVLAQRKMSVKELMSWKKGSVVQLPGASTETVSAVVSAGVQRIRLAQGDLGAANGTKCLRLTDVKGAPPATAAKKMAS